MSKFKKDRVVSESLTNEQSIKMDKFVSSSPDIISEKKKEPTKLISVPLAESDALILEKLCLIEDRSQRRIASRLLTESLSNEIKKYS